MLSLRNNVSWWVLLCCPLYVKPM